MASRDDNPTAAILETERLLLREFILDDVEEFFRLTSDAEITRFTGDSCQSLEEAKTGLQERVFRDYETRGYGRWAVIHKQAGKVIGAAGLKVSGRRGRG